MVPNDSIVQKAQSAFDLEDAAACLKVVVAAIGLEYPPLITAETISPVLALQPRPGNEIIQFHW